MVSSSSFSGAIMRWALGRMYRVPRSFFLHDDTIARRIDPEWRAILSSKPFIISSTPNGESLSSAPRITAH
ncbi:hypothetical protein BHE74_00047343 [Ensete ventricosum]|nr:hypothetical protein GW17_00032580 [Ensete ventricosum]RWW46714.1 hypothetical protein BHE74_00047343 [Ensete ventricosum]RZR87418.1 hypothetical protein BHM03_00014816 [Ensete ventricosum]